MDTSQHTTWNHVVGCCPVAVSKFMHILASVAKVFQKQTLALPKTNSQKMAPPPKTPLTIQILNENKGGGTNPSDWLTKCFLATPPRHTKKNARIVFLGGGGGRGRLWRLGKDSQVWPNLSLAPIENEYSHTFPHYGTRQPSTAILVR